MEQMTEVLEKAQEEMRLAQQRYMESMSQIQVHFSNAVQKAASEMQQKRMSESMQPQEETDTAKITTEPKSIEDKVMFLAQSMIVIAQRVAQLEAAQQER